MSLVNLTGNEPETHEPMRNRTHDWSLWVVTSLIGLAFFLT